VALTLASTNPPEERAVQKRFVTLALGVLSIPMLGGVAYAAAHSISDRPSPQVVIPASSRTSAGGADDPASHEANHAQGTDDSGNHLARTTATTAVNPPTRASDDGPNHDVGDDHGGAATAGPTTTVAGHDVGDDHGGSSGSSSSGSGSSGSGSSGSGSSGSGSSGSGSSGSDDRGGSGGHGADG
jgi:hypothetical protein